MYYQLPDINYSLDFEDELCLLRSAAKVALDVVDDKQLQRVSAKRVAEACRVLTNVPHVVTDAEVDEVTGEFGLDQELRAALEVAADLSCEEVADLMNATIPDCDENTSRAFADAYAVVRSEPPLSAGRPRPIRRRYLMSDRLTKLCEGGGNRTPVEEFGLLRRYAREVVVLYDAALDTGEPGLITRAIVELQDVIMDVIVVGAIAARILGPVYHATLRNRVATVVGRLAYPPGKGADMRWVEASLAIADLFKQHAPSLGTTKLPSGERVARM